MARATLYEPVENYGVIGNLETVALVSLRGSIDFMSFPRIDSPTIFTKLLDARKGGSFTIAPVGHNLKYKQLYFPDSAILITRFFSSKGIAELIDFMPIKENGDCTIIRKVKVVRGKMKFRMSCEPRFNYAKLTPSVSKWRNGVKFQANHNEHAFLYSNIALNNKKTGSYAEFDLQESAEGIFIFTNSVNGEALAEMSEQNAKFRKTKIFWQKWIAQCKYKGRWREIVNRSAITLKLLTSYRYGSAVAAATFGLPEIIKGKRNWDYRYTWTRDAAFTMYAFLRLGFMNEAASFINWIADLCRNRRMQTMYAVDGKTDLKEKNLSYLSGYRDTRPVKIGNAAHQQFQLDIYGELIDTIYLYNKHGGPITYELWQEIERQIEFVIAHWKKPDHGIWEIRKRQKEFLHSKVMCWVALDRAIRIAESRSFPYPFVEWQTIRNEIYDAVFKTFWNEKKQAFVQHKGSNEMDGSVLLMPLVRIVSPYEHRWEKTMRAVEKELKSDVLIYRYRGKDVHAEGIGGDEGTFTMCSFWFVECLSKMGENDRAVEFFEKMLGYANHLGLFSEQLGLEGEHLGNFPQAFTHLSLISAAIQLDKALEKNNSG